MLTRQPLDKKTYQLILCFRKSNVTGVANLNVINYYVSRPVVLPMDKYIKCSCSFFFKSENYAGVLANNEFVNVNIGRTQIFDGITQSSNLGIIYLVISNVAAGSQLSFYNSTNNDNNRVIIYPTQNIVTVTLNTWL